MRSNGEGSCACVTRPGAAGTSRRAATPNRSAAARTIRSPGCVGSPTGSRGCWTSCCPAYGIPSRTIWAPPSSAGAVGRALFGSLGQKSAAGVAARARDRRRRVACLPGAGLRPLRGRASAERAADTLSWSSPGGPRRATARFGLTDAGDPPDPARLRTLSKSTALMPLLGVAMTNPVAPYDAAIGAASRKAALHDLVVWIGLPSGYGRTLHRALAQASVAIAPTWADRLWLRPRRPRAPGRLDDVELTAIRLVAAELARHREGLDPDPGSTPRSLMPRARSCATAPASRHTPILADPR